MYSLWSGVWKKTSSTYHKIMHAYTYILYQDCLDSEMKEAFFTKMRYHQAKIDTSA
ncbi:hypothetical protein [Paenibacillus pectinilyticus]|uniref:hypothetical protein n=1 Tax=Paenibacillus pectinilyticus TaxID=512399 RepID=UPI00142894EC|nr:hypothetical protein [Paenibacillus pectinilyticus]